MHVPDGFFTLTVSLSTGAVAAAGVAGCLRGAKRELDDRTAPLAGLVAAFVFAAQLINFPVLAGTSGHLLGGALAAILVGPYTGVLCVAVVLLVQGLFFADGGLSALGVNITLMGLVTVLVGWGVFLLVTKAVQGRGAVIAGAFLAGLVSVPASALAFTLLFWAGGNAPIELSSVAAAMVGVHVLIGVGEGLITAMTVSAVLAVRPDLVHGHRRTGTREGRPTSTRGALRPFLLGGLGVTLLLAGVVSFFASADPDGLESVAAARGFDVGVDHLFASWALAGYGEVGGIPVGVAGIAGAGLTLIVAGGVAYAARRRTRVEA